MEAMILAAGLGTRLRPLTNDKPKALVDVGGQPMLERTAHRVVDAGFEHLVINVHHFADRVKKVIEEKDGFGAEVSISHEVEKNLETGGGVKHAEPQFRKEGPFLVHNVDILTDLDLKALHDAHDESGALATLAVRPVETNRYLSVDQRGHVVGYGDPETGEEHLVTDPQGSTEKVDFIGVQVISPRIFDLMTEEGVFSIINVYMRLIAEEGEAVRTHRADDALWIDIGTHERLEKARRYVEGKKENKEENLLQG
jgi:NDP-sugar pyrophosphorylase family protein